MGERLRETGQEYGASTGRPRRCGWFDAVAVRYAVRVNGLDALAITKLDVLDGLEYLDVCTAYRCGGRIVTEMPGDTAMLAACTPVYERVPGWTRPTRGVTRHADLPLEARQYIGRLEAICGVPAAIISTGSDREHTIVRAVPSLPDLPTAGEDADERSKYEVRNTKYEAKAGAPTPD
jgi:adenylosuccinate synthase